jgi:hypothetical protein
MKNSFFILVSLFCISAYSQNQAKAVKRGLSYLNGLSLKDFPSYNQKMLLTMLQRDYNFPVSLRTNMLSDSILHEDDAFSKKYLSSIIDLGRSVPNDLNQVYRKAEGIQKLILWSSNSDVLVPDSSIKIIFEYTCFSDTNIRQVGHAAFACYLAHRTTGSRWSEFLQPFQLKIAERLPKMIIAHKIVTDNALEGIVGLICIGRKDLIPMKWMKRIKRVQNTDGGWSFDPFQNTEVSNSHTTLLAVWILIACQP